MDLNIKDLTSGMKEINGKLQATFDIRSLPECSVIAGGCPRAILEFDGDIRDIDLFVFKDKYYKSINEHIQTLPLKYSLKLKKFENKFLTTWVSTYPSMILQVIRIPGLDSVTQVLESFDLRCCQVAFDMDKFYSADDALTDIQKKQLVFLHSTQPVSTIRRIAKYTQYGYRCNQDSLRNFVQGIRDLDTCDINLSLYPINSEEGPIPPLSSARKEVDIPF